MIVAGAPATGEISQPPEAYFVQHSLIWLDMPCTCDANAGSALRQHGYKQTMPVQLSGTESVHSSIAR